jgi:hypothetical protein
MKTKKNTWGGPRPGAGRPKGSGKGRRVVTRSINLPPEVWAEIDRLRGPLSRSKWIKKLVEMLPQLKDLLAEEHARLQGVQPVSNFSALFGAGKGEDWDGFDEALEQWRKGNADKRRSALDDIAKKANDLGLY